MNSVIARGNVPRGRVSRVVFLDAVMPKKKTPSYFSQRDVADYLSVEPWSVRYAVSSRRIDHTIFVGKRRLYDIGAVEQIKVALAQIAWKHRHSNHVAVTA